MNILMQSERLIGSYGLSFVILWIVSLTYYTVATKKGRYLILTFALYFALLLPGIHYFTPNVSYSDTLQVAYTTGQYVGDFLNFSEISYEKSEKSLEKSIVAAASENAEMLVFNEESFELDDTEEAAFTEKCSELAQKYDIAVLVGLDVTDTDNSGKSENKLVFIDNKGVVQGSYSKYRLIPIIESGYEPGDGKIPSHELDINGKHVKISYAICYDSNFPSYINNMDNDTDILFLPSWDWSAVTELHSKLVAAISGENHVAVLKPTYDGLTIATDPDGRIFHTSTTDETGYEHMEVVEMPIKSSAVLSCREEALPPFDYAIISTELFSVLISLILFGINVYVNREKTGKAKFFSVMIFVNVVGCISDAVSYILDGCERLEALLYVVTILAMVLTFVIIAVFISYITEHIREKKEISPLISRIYWVYTVTVCLFTVIASLKGYLFVMEGGVYYEGPVYSIYVVMNILSVIFSYVIIAMYRNYLDGYDKTVAYAYLTIPVVAAFINIFVEEFSFAFPATTLSLMMIYIMLQSDTVERVKNEGRIIEHFATHDDLTGLKNHRAFRERVDVLTGVDGSSGIVFGDLNGLKFANDNFGHEAGDRLLIDYAEILATIFRINEIYRISGDEFICMMENVEENTFFNRVKLLENRLNTDEKPLACIGAAYGKNNDIEVLYQQAESIMYREKKLFHERFPETKR
ncbi:MAG: diguanylate cyclase [Clostridia bacterium]|nr:diguanylate cyclase [Clostridia bacterium]